MNKKHLIVGSALVLGLSSIAYSGAYAIETSGINSATDLKNCLTSASAICNLGADIDLTEAITITGKVELNLGEYKITEGDSFDHADYCMLTVASGAKLTINGVDESGIFAETAWAAVRMTSPETYNSSKEARLVVNGGTLSGYYYGITGNGGRSNTRIIINGGTITGVAENDNVGIYHPQDGELIINGGTVTGATGIAMKSGILTVLDGEIIGNGEDDTPTTGYGNGINVSGAAIQIESNTGYVGNMEIYLHKADLFSENSVAFYEYIGKGTDTRVNVIKIGAVNFQGGKEAFWISDSLEDKGQPTIMDGYMVTEDEDTVISTEKVADVIGLGDDESMSISQLDLNDGGDIISDLEEKGLTVEAAYEITIKDGDSNIIDETDNEITFEADVPSEPAEGYTREWSLYYIHNSVLKQNNTLKVENGKFTWKANEFSTYIFAYKDTVTPGAPNTGDFTKEAGSVSAGISIAAIASAVICGAAYLIKRALRR